LRALAAKLNLVFVYGSIADGRAQSDSDIDLMVIGRVSPMELALPLRRARELLGREINPTICTPAEFDKRRAMKDHFLLRVLGQPKLIVMGNADELEQTAE
jgi:predicted nucleotidyltransferase